MRATPPIRADSPLPPSQLLPAPAAVLHPTLGRTRPSRARIVLYWEFTVSSGRGGTVRTAPGSRAESGAGGCGQLQGRRTPQGRTCRSSWDTAMALLRLSFGPWGSLAFCGHCTLWGSAEGGAGGQSWGSPAALQLGGNLIARAPCTPRSLEWAHSQPASSSSPVARSTACCVLPGTH